MLESLHLVTELLIKRGTLCLISVLQPVLVSFGVTPLRILICMVSHDRFVAS